MDEQSIPVLQTQLDEITANTRRLVQAERLEINENAIAELFATGIEDRILPVGSRAPEFSLPDAISGKPIRSADLLALGPLVINFFRGRWCPYCITELETWRELYLRIAIFLSGTKPPLPVIYRRGLGLGDRAFPCRYRVGLPHLWAFSAMKTPLHAPSGIPSNRKML
ncbi:redoxin domain-containing protein [Terriglobus sp. YAF25]|uniref:redoxin domain-containing protein n=1 Tax=Terriglobus sp. YAF25 TaxID=3233080 RepID=UPI003F96620F